MASKRRTYTREERLAARRELEQGGRFSLEKLGELVKKAIPKPRRTERTEREDRDRQWLLRAMRPLAGPNGPPIGGRLARLHLEKPHTKRTRTRKGGITVYTSRCGRAVYFVVSGPLATCKRCLAQAQRERLKALKGRLQ
ncbi:MAG: hypothetical protein C5B58_07460 [Acidobacteria bacterium]|nr:MAG: hypothetical protein C5B58_07460 [Acidobacteriota bacterium]